MTIPTMDKFEIALWSLDLYTLLVRKIMDPLQNLIRMFIAPPTSNSDIEMAHIHNESMPDAELPMGRVPHVEPYRDAWAAHNSWQQEYR